MDVRGTQKSEKSGWRRLMPKKSGIRYKSTLAMPIAKKLMRDLTREKTILFAIFLHLLFLRLLL